MVYGAVVYFWHFFLAGMIVGVRGFVHVTMWAGFHQYSSGKMAYVHV